MDTRVDNIQIPTLAKQRHMEAKKNIWKKKQKNASSQHLVPIEQYWKKAILVFQIVLVRGILLQM